MQRKTHRIDQVNKFIQHKFGEIINLEMELPDNVLVNVTQVKTSPDLRLAKIWLSIYPDNFADKIFGIILHDLKRLKHLLRQQITFKYALDIRLLIDSTAQHAQEMEKLLNKIMMKETPKSITGGTK